MTVGLKSWLAVHLAARMLCMHKQKIENLACTSHQKSGNFRAIKEVTAWHTDLRGLHRRDGAAGR